MLDRDIAAALGEPAAMPPLTREIVPMIRAGMAAAGRALSGPELAEVRDIDADGVPTRLYRPTQQLEAFCAPPPEAEKRTG